MWQTIDILGLVDILGLLVVKPKVNDNAHRELINILPTLVLFSLDFLITIVYLLPFNYREVSLIIKYCFSVL